MKATRMLMLPVVALLAGCSAAAMQSASTTTKQAEWTTGCQDDQIDPYGKLVERAKCWTMVSDFTRSNDGAPVGVDTIFEINAKGARMVENTAFDTDICAEVPKRIAVDGRRIDTLPMPARIEAALAGQRVTREKDRPWPYCNVMNETMSMAGARAAYDQMVAAWRARG